MILKPDALLATTPAKQRFASAAGRVARSRVIAVASGKGGVGKTNVAVNLGLALARRGVRVALLDADLGTANVDVVMGLRPRYHLQHVVTGQKSLAEILIQGPWGMLIVPGASGLPDLADLPDAQRDILLRAFLVLEGAVDLLLIDTGAGVHRSVVQFILAASEVLLVTTPEPTAVIDAYALLKILASYESPFSASLVVNSERRRGEGEVTGRRLVDLAQQFLGQRVEVLGTLPFDPRVMEAVRLQRPLVQSYPRCPATLAIEQLSERLWSGRAVPEARGGISHFFRQVLSWRE